MAKQKTPSRAEFDFRITYFNPNGSLHFTTTAKWEVPTDPVGGPAMEHAMSKLRGLRNSGGQMGMPGDIDEGWPGPIMLGCDNPIREDRLLMPAANDYERLVALLDSLGMYYEEESREQRVVIQRHPEREGLAKLILAIDAGVGLGASELRTNFYFDGHGKFLSHATYDDK